MFPLIASQRRKPPNPLPQNFRENLRITFVFLNPVHCLNLQSSFPHHKTHPSKTPFHHPFPTAPSILSTIKILNCTAFYFSCLALIHGKTFQVVYTSEWPLNSLNSWDRLENEECLWACMGKKEQPGSR